MKAEIDFNPPGWPVSCFDQVRLDPVRSVAFDAFRKRLCEYLGKNNEICDPNNLFTKALDLLIENESALLSKVEKLT
jgi:hypothetical protein